MVVYRLLADGVVVIHASYLIFLVVGGFLAWRWKSVLWAHLVTAVWAFAIVAVDFGCPFTGVEKSLRRRGGEDTYAGGYIEHYVEGRIYPEGYTWLAEYVAFGLIIVAYVGLAVRGLWRVRRRAQGRFRRQGLMRFDPPSIVQDDTKRYQAISSGIWP